MELTHTAKPSKLSVSTARALNSWVIDTLSYYEELNITCEYLMVLILEMGHVDALAYLDNELDYIHWRKLQRIIFGD